MLKPTWGSFKTWKKNLLLGTLAFLFSDLGYAGISQWTAADLKRPRNPGVVLFKLKKGVQVSDLNQFQFVTPQNEMAAADFSESRTLHSTQVYEFQFASAQALLHQGHRLSEEQFSSQLMDTGLVEYAEPDYASLPDMTPNDPVLKSQWYTEKLGLQPAWDITTGKDQVQVLVCDTGVLSNHPDLKGNVMPGHNFVDESGNTEPSGNAHGTLVSGLIGAKGNNGIGIAGLNWNVQIIPGKISNEKNGMSYTSTMVKCVKWAMDHNIRLVNLSYNGNGDETLSDAAKALYEKNGLLILTIGNTGEEVSFPKNPYLLRVGATDHYDFKAYWSNTGECLDIVAPGTSIYSTDASGGISRVQGTSFSAPIVTGAAALLLSLDPQLSSAGIKKVLLDSAKDLGDKGIDKAFGYGRLDILNAIKTLQDMKK